MCRCNQVLVGLVACLVLTASPADASEPTIQDDLELARAYEFGQSRAALVSIERAVTTADDGEARADLEAMLLALIQDESSTRDARRFACRQLAIIGSGRSARILVGLLGEPALADVASDALERIDDPSINELLIDTLVASEFDPKVKLEIIDALGARRASEAVETLERIAQDSPSELRSAAFAALGRIGDKAARRALMGLEQAFLENSEREAIVNGLLQCALSMHMDGEDRWAAATARHLLDSSNPQAVQMGALRVYVEARGEHAPVVLTAFAYEEDETWRTFALELIRTTGNSALTEQLIQYLDTVPIESRADVILALGERGDPGAESGLLALVDHEFADVSISAMRALREIGTAQSVDALVGIESTMTGPTRATAIGALLQLSGNGVDEAILAAAHAAESRSKAQLIEILGQRQAYPLAEAILQFTHDDHQEVRLAALHAMALLGGSEELPQLVTLVRDAADEGERELASSALQSAIMRSRERNLATQMIQSAMSGTRSDVKSSYLMVLAHIGGPAALETVRAHTDDQGTKDIAVKALASWIDDSAADVLATLMEHDPDEAIRARAFSGYLRAAAMTELRSDAATATMLVRAMHAAGDNVEQQTAILEVATQVHDVTTLNMAWDHLDDDVTGKAAADTMIAIASALPADHRNAAIAALTDVRRTRLESDLHARASAAINKIERFDDYIMIWQIAGPYRKNDVGGAQILDEIFKPETDQGHPTVVWRDLFATAAAFPGRIDLTGEKDSSNCCVYARTQIWSESPREVRFELASDDGIKAWLNGEVIHSNNVMRGLTPGDDKVNAMLRAGWNQLMLKVSQGGGGWEFACRLRDVDGSALSDIRFDPHGRSIAPPDDAVVLLGAGTGGDTWEHADGADMKWRIEEDGVMTVTTGAGNAISRETFEDFTLHLEFMLPDDVDPRRTGQARSNSGVYIFGTYEVQILDSWGLPPASNLCGGLYRFRASNVNASKRAGEWQTYDIEFIAARWNEVGEKLSNARISVRHNGVLVHDNVYLDGPTGMGRAERPGAQPIFLQDHGNPIQFRNIWVVRHSPHDDVDAAGAAELAKPQAIFDGTSLEGWHRLGGQAEYAVTDGCIIGETRPNQPNTFLCTEQTYRDFILDLEFKVHPELNSGVQIRSNSHAEYMNHRVHGYQVEIDPSDRAWSTGIYDEARRGWLFPLEDHERARRAFQQDEWNRVRIIARGDVIRTYLNGVPSAMLIDGTTAEGFIGLQVHGVGGRTDPLTVMWRNISLRELN